MRAIIFAFIFSFSFFLFGCVDDVNNGETNENQSLENNSIQIPGEKFTMHEWGVVLTCNSSDSLYLTSRPEQRIMVKLPVIYFYNSPKNFKVRVEMEKLNETYPEGTKSSRSITWDIGEKEQSKSVSSGSRNLIPMEEAIKKLDNNESDMLNVGGASSSFLYYEGEVSNFVDKTFLSNNEIENKNDYALKDVFIVSFEGNFINGKSKISYFPEISGGKKANLNYNLSKDEAELLLSKVLSKRGFYEGEKQTFISTWKESIFYPTNTGFTQIFYLLPEDKTSQFSSVDVSPAPEEEKRFLFILKDFNS